MPAANRLRLGLRVTAAALLTGAAWRAGGPASAHKGLISAYTYEEQVRPILQARCGACHNGRGSAPMSVLEYDDAAPWAEAIREQLTTEAMPPWFVDGTGAAIKGAQKLSPRELDVLLTWSAGGAPRGGAATRPPLRSAATWTLGRPDVVLQLPPQDVAGGTPVDEVRDARVAIGSKGDRWLKAVELLPSDGAPVRDASIRIDGGPLLDVWCSGDEAVAAPPGTAFAVPAGAALRVSVHYRRAAGGQAPFKDRGRVGLYFADAPPASGRILSRDLAPAPHATLAADLPAGARILALRPTLRRDYQAVQVDAVSEAGRRPLLRLRAPRAGWPRRYWLADPIALPAASRIEATAIALPGSAGAGSAGLPFEMSVDYLPE